MNADLHDFHNYTKVTIARLTVTIQVIRIQINHNSDKSLRQLLFTSCVILCTTIQLGHLLAVAFSLQLNNKQNFCNAFRKSVAEGYTATVHIVNA